MPRYGLENQVKEINEAAIQIAKRVAAPGGQFVLGTIGGIRGIRKRDASKDEIIATIDQQAIQLLLGKPDGLLLEMYYDLEELTARMILFRLSSLPKSRRSREAI